MVEGQGALLHPAYSGVTLGLVHGSAPHAFVLCHLAGQTEIEGYPGHPLISLPELVELHERMSLPARKATVAAIALNTRELGEDEARAAVAAAAGETGSSSTIPSGSGLSGCSTPSSPRSTRAPRRQRICRAAPVSRGMPAGSGRLILRDPPELRLPPVGGDERGRRRTAGRPRRDRRDPHLGPRGPEARLRRRFRWTIVDGTRTWQPSARRRAGNRGARPSAHSPGRCSSSRSVEAAVADLTANTCSCIMANTCSDDVIVVALASSSGPRSPVPPTRRGRSGAMSCSRTTRSGRSRRAGTTIRARASGRSRGERPRGNHARPGAECSSCRSKRHAP